MGHPRNNFDSNKISPANSLSLTYESGYYLREKRKPHICKKKLKQAICTHPNCIYKQ